MQSTGQTSTQAVSQTPTHGSQITYVMVTCPSRSSNPRAPASLIKSILIDYIDRPICQVAIGNGRDVHRSGGRLKRIGELNSLMKCGRGDMIGPRQPSAIRGMKNAPRTERPPSTRRHLLDEIKLAGVATVDELVLQLGLSKTAVRAHLLPMEAEGLLERVTSDSGRPGRPPLAFRITAKANGLYPTLESELLSELLGFLNADGKSDLIELFFERLWQKRYDEFAAELASQSAAEPVDKLAALQRVLERNHFMPKIEIIRLPRSRNRGEERTCVRVSECHCPLAAAVNATTLPCRMEARFLASVIGVKPSSVRTAPDHLGHCVFTFQLEPAKS